MFKEFFKQFIPKLVEFIFVIALGFLVCIAVIAILGEESLGIAAVAVVFYYFGGMIRPYIKELQEKFTKNIGEKK
jgi:hypothetical protein